MCALLWVCKTGSCRALLNIETLISEVLVRKSFAELHNISIYYFLTAKGARDRQAHACRRFAFKLTLVYCMHTHTSICNVFVSLSHDYMHPRRVLKKRALSLIWSSYIPTYVGDVCRQLGWVCDYQAVDHVFVVRLAHIVETISIRKGGLVALKTVDKIPLVFRALGCLQSGRCKPSLDE